MPFLDRSWWLRIAGGLALIIAALALANAYSASTRTSRSAAASPWAPWLDMLFTLLLPLLAVVVALCWGYGAWRARQRAIARSQALAGRLDAMPFAAFSGDPAQAPDLSSEPLVIMWRPNQKIQRAIWLIALLTLALDIVIIYGARALMGVKLPVSVNFASFWPRLALISAILLLVALHVAILLAAPLALAPARRRDLHQRWRPGALPLGHAALPALGGRPSLRGRGDPDAQPPLHALRPAWRRLLARRDPCLRLRGGAAARPRELRSRRDRARGDVAQATRRARSGRRADGPRAAHAQPHSPAARFLRQGAGRRRHPCDWAVCACPRRDRLAARSSPA